MSNILDAIFNKEEDRLTAQQVSNRKTRDVMRDFASEADNLLEFADSLDDLMSSALIDFDPKKHSKLTLPYKKSIEGCLSVIFSNEDNHPLCAYIEK